MRILLVGVAVLSGCGAESQIRKKVLAVCQNGQLGGPNTLTWPSDSKMSDFLREEDIDFLEKKETAETNGLAAAVVTAMQPAIVALAEARRATTTCEVTTIVVADERATIEVTERFPKVDLGSGLASLGKIGELSKLDATERSTRAKKWFVEAAEKNTQQHSVVAIKTADGWRIDLQLPEAAKKKEQERQRLEEAVATLKKALAHAEVCELKEAAALIEKARELTPTDPALDQAGDLLSKRRAVCVGGRWIKNASQNAMTDDIEMTMTLMSDNEIPDEFRPKRGAIVGRCSEKRVELFVSTETMLDDTFQVGVEARYRFGTEKAERLVLSRSTSYQGAFFRNANTWIDTLIAKQDQAFSLELPIYGSRSAVLKFSLDGADKALGELKKVCR